MADYAIENRFKVKLIQKPTYGYTNTLSEDKRKRTDRVIFDVTPDLTETQNVEYKTMQPVHMPGQIYVYGSSSSRTFSLSSVRLVSRTIEEATVNQRRLNTLRGWTKPYFGRRSDTNSLRRIMEDDQGRNSNSTSRPTDASYLSQEMLGRPPDVLLLSAYSDIPENNKSGVNKRNIPLNIHNIPVVIQSFSAPWPSDVDYIPTQYGQPFPRVMILDIQLLETHAPREFEEKFSLHDYRRGLLRGF